MPLMIHRGRDRRDPSTSYRYLIHCSIPGTDGVFVRGAASKMRMADSNLGFGTNEGCDADARSVGGDR